MATRLSQKIYAALAIVGLTAALGACSSQTEEKPAADTQTTATDAFPVTIESALGNVTINEKPERIATWGWSAQDAVLALGQVPVAMPTYTYGGVDGVLPWVKEKIDALGGDQPTLLKGADNGTANPEEFVAARPDVILAPYSGLTQEEYDALSKIAPVVAYPDQPWATSWQDQTLIVGKALGLNAEAQKLVDDTNTYVKELGAQHPELAGKTFAYGANNQPEILNVYIDTDPRAQLLVDLGMTLAPSVEELLPENPDKSFYYGLAFENLNKLTSDVLVAYFGDQAAADAFTNDPLVAAMPQVKAGAFAPIIGESFVMASSAPTTLSIPWMLDQYVPQLAQAAKNVK
ncbi:iron-siderophore ABC transporter substrate-binding protein [Timonella sp. A28]|uniref:iron-siderophore ABC transporter substrate-binding protein n=1 Tax=Timonella sp. A28 TaxID=3442640 RepID=UPI003EC05258